MIFIIQKQSNYRCTFRWHLSCWDKHSCGNISRVHFRTLSVAIITGNEERWQCLFPWIVNFWTCWPTSSLVFILFQSWGSTPTCTQNQSTKENSRICFLFSLTLKTSFTKLSCSLQIVSIISSTGKCTTALCHSEKIIYIQFICALRLAGKLWHHKLTLFYLHVSMSLFKIKVVVKQVALMELLQHQNIFRNLQMSLCTIHDCSCIDISLDNSFTLIGQWWIVRSGVCMSVQSRQLTTSIV